MRKWTALLLVLSVALAASITTTSASHDVQSNTPGSTLDSKNLHQLVSEFYQAFFPEEVAPGLAVAVVQGDRILYLQGFGYADLEAKRKVTPDSIFYIGSSSKSFLALTAALLDEQKKVDLDAPLSRYLPKLKLQSPLSTDEVTLRALLSHTHGIEQNGSVVFRTAFSGDFTPDLLLKLLEKSRPSPNGRSFRYGNIGYNIAGMALESHLETNWKALIQQNVLKPLKMDSSTSYRSKADQKRLALPYSLGKTGYKREFYAKNDGNMHAAGGLMTSAEDLAKWLLVNINQGRLGKKQIFPAAVIAETHRKHTDLQSKYAEVDRNGYGLGWYWGTNQGDKLIHSYGGFSSFFAHVSFMPEHKIGVAVLSHEFDIGGRAAETLAMYIYDILRARPGAKEKWAQRLVELPKLAKQRREAQVKHMAERAARQQPLPHPLESYAGIYEHPELGRMEWRLVNGKLESSIGLLRSQAEIYNAGNETVRVELTPGEGEVIRFFFGESEAQATSMEFRGAKFQRVRGD